MANGSLANIAVEKSRVKEYYTSSSNRTVYLDNNTEFQIELFNPFKYYIGVTVSFDNESEGETLFVLRPGERFWLDRYLNTPKKFKFSTYKVEDSKEAKEAISENGKVTLRFYKEKEKEYKPQITTWTSNDNWWNNPLDDLVDIKYNYTCGDNSSIVRSFSKPLSSINTAGNGDYICNFSSARCSDSIISALNDQILDVKDQILTTSCTNNSTIETGRIEEGSQSSQRFTNVERDFSTIPFKTETFKILPTSQKPVTSSDIQKRFCYNCGKKIKEKFKFCPNCGAEQ